MEVDSDKDGKITGEQARNLFLSWRLPRGKDFQSRSLLYIKNIIFLLIYEMNCYLRCN